MAFLAKLFFGYFAEFRAEWNGIAPGCPPTEALVEALSNEGILLRSSCFEPKRVRLVVEVEDGVSPILLTQRLKGRMGYALRKENSAFPGFSSQFFLRSLGQNTRDVVGQYIRKQVDRSDLVDPLYRERMKDLCFHDEELTVQKTRHRGVYDLFVHLILVTGERYRMSSAQAKKVFDALVEASRQLGADPLEISMMPDHAHLLLRWPERMNAGVLLAEVKRESGRLFGRSAFWNNGGYVGTVGPYPLSKAHEKNAREGGWRRVQQSG